MNGVWWLGGHLGAAVSALVDGELDPESSERAWAHVATCPTCRQQVEREGWVKRRVSTMAGAEHFTLPTGLVGSLLQGAPHGAAVESPRQGDEVAAAWAAVESIERRHRPRRRAGLAIAGVGSVSVAVLGLSALGAAPLDIGGGTTTPSVRPAPSVTPSGGPNTAPVARTPGVPPGAAGEAPSLGAGLPTSGPFTRWRLGVAGDGGNQTLPVGVAR